jgi:hypothetical protein
MLHHEHLQERARDRSVRGVRADVLRLVQHDAPPGHAARAARRQPAPHGALFIFFPYFVNSFSS